MKIDSILPILDRFLYKIGHCKLFQKLFNSSIIEGFLFVF